MILRSVLLSLLLTGSLVPGEQKEEGPSQECTGGEGEFSDFIRQLICFSNIELLLEEFPEFESEFKTLSLEEKEKVASALEQFSAAFMEALAEIKT